LHPHFPGGIVGVWAGMGPFWRPKEILEETKEPEHSIRKAEIHLGRSTVKEIP